MLFIKFPETVGHTSYFTKWSTWEIPKTMIWTWVSRMLFVYEIFKIINCLNVMNAMEFKLVWIHKRIFIFLEYFSLNVWCILERDRGAGYLPSAFGVGFEGTRPHMKGIRTETGTYKQKQINEVQSKRHVLKCARNFSIPNVFLLLSRHLSQCSWFFWSI